MNLIVGIPNRFLNVPMSPQKLLIMVGVPGSGKSTTANRLISLNKNWSRVNQDEMKSRKACEIYAKDALKKGLSVIVDRCNFDILQRNVWIKIASEFGVNHIWCLYFKIPHEICKARVTVREDHPTIPKGDKGCEIIDTFASSLVPPAFEEGLSEIITVTNDQELEAVIPKLAELLKTRAEPHQDKQKSSKKKKKRS